VNELIVDEIKAWLPLAISLAALIVSIISGLATWLDHRASSRLAREKDILDWVRTIEELYSRLLSQDHNNRKEALNVLSLRIDFGRLFFPNERNWRSLQVNPRGFRSSVLNPLVETLNRVSNSSDLNQLEIKKDWLRFCEEISRQTTAFAFDTSPEAEGRDQYRNR
jgi:hypothetical protein